MPLDTNHHWQQFYGYNVWPYSWSCYLKLKVCKDTIINGKTYSYIKNITNGCNPNTGGSSGLLRQDTLLKRVIILQGNQENILYNFNKNVGDTALLSGTIYTLQSKDSILINDSLYHKRFQFQTNGLWAVTVIEGVGSTAGLLTPIPLSEIGYLLECFVRIHPSSKTIYSIGGLGTNCPIDLSIPLNIENKKKLSIFPNPSADIININTLDIIPQSIEIKNTIGQTILFLNNIDKEISKINISDFTGGVYFIKVNFGYENIIGFFIKN